MYVIGILVNLVWAMSLPAFAASGITYQGRLIKPNGTPVTSNVQFRLQIRSPGNEDCLLYEELQSQDLSTTSGVFALSLGDGTGVRQDPHTLDWTLFESLSNRKDFAFGSGECSIGNVYTPSYTDNRRFRVFFNDGNQAPGTWEALPLQAINFVPTAAESLSVGGFSASSLLRVEQGGALVNTAPLNNAQYTELLALLAGSSNQYTRDGELNGAALPVISNNQSVRWNAGAWEAFVPLTSESDPTVQAFAKSALPICGVGTVLKSDGTSLSCVPDTGGWSAVDATDTVKGIVNIPTAGGLTVTTGALSIADQAGVTPGSYAKVTVNAKGIVTAHGSLIESDIPTLSTAGKVSGSAITSGTIGGSTSINTTGTITTSGAVTAGTVSTGRISSSEHRVYDLDASPADNYVAIKVPASIGANYDMVLPATQGLTNQILGMNNAANGMEYKSITAGSGVTINHTAGGIEIVANNSGTVTSVTGTANQIDVDSSTPATPVISLANLAVSPSGTYGSTTQIPKVTVDTKGRVTGVTLETIAITNIQGNPVQSGTPSDGQVYRYDGSGSPMFKPAYLSVQDIRSIANNAVSVFPSSCTTSQTMTWSALTDTFACSNISIAHGSLSGLTSGDDHTQYALLAGRVGGQSLVGGTANNNNLTLESTSAGTKGYVLLQPNGGSVGIGTTHPTGVLDIFSNNGSGSTVKIMRGNNAHKANVGLIPAGSISPTNSSWIFGMDSNSNDFRISSWDGSVTKVSLSASNTGNVGIGTATPARVLHVEGPVRFAPSGVPLTPAAGDIYIDSTDSNKLKWHNGSTWQTVGTGSGSGDIMNGGNTGAVTVGTNDATSMTLETNNTPRMTVLSDGNVGIGTTSPSFLLDVRKSGAGSQMHLSGTGNDNGLYLFGYNSNTGYVSSGASHNGTGWVSKDSSATLMEQSASSTGLMNLYFNSGLTIGNTFTPNLKVSMGTYSNITSQPQVLAIGGGGSAPDSGSVSWGDGTGWKLNFGPNISNVFTPRVTFVDNGNVGIGTNNPGRLLHVNGPVRITPSGAPGGAAAGDMYVDSGDSNKLKWYNGSGWQTVSTGAGTVTSVTGTANEITVGGTASAPVIGLGNLAVSPAGTFGSATQVPVVTVDAKGRVTGVVNTTISGTSPVGSTLNSGQMWVGSSGNVAAAVSMSGDATLSNAGALKVTAIQNFPVTATTPTDGQVYRYNGGGSQFRPAHLNVQDIRSVANNAVSVFPSACTSSQTMTWSALTDTFACSNISIASTQVTGLTAANVTNTPAGTIAATTVQAALNELDGDKVSKTGDTMTGALNLPSNGLVVGTNQLVVSGGNVGIGTTAPAVDTIPAALKIMRSDMTWGLAIENAAGSFQTDILLNTTSNSADYKKFQLVNVGNSFNLRSVKDDDSLSKTYMHIDLPSGNVGIGTTNPGHLLSVANPSGSASVSLFGADTSQTGLNMGVNTNNRWLLYQDVAANGRSLGIWHDHTSVGGGTGQIMTFLPTGNVGIGTTSPSAKLHIQDGTLFMKGAYNGTNRIVFNDTSTGKEWEIYPTNGGAGGFSIFNRTDYVAPFFIRNDGNVGVGTTNPAYKLDVNGTIRGYGITDSSDIRLKHDVQPLQEDLNKILNLQGVSYYWNDPQTHGDRRQVGVIAQDVEKIYPELVETDDQGMKSVNYSHFVAPLIEAVKTLYDRLVGVETRQDTQDREIASVKAENEKLKQENAAKAKELEEIKARLDKIERALSR